MERTTEKILGFEYVVNHLNSWFQSHDGSNTADNDLSKLKIIKLHFFTSAVCANTDDDLLDFFDSFYAMPYGHVESEIYSNIEKLQIFKLTERNLEINPEIDQEAYFSHLHSDIRKRIDNSISELRKINNNLVKYVAMDLVELSHSWYSWRAMYNLARSFHKHSISIPVDVIRKEPKKYILPTVESSYAVY